MVGRQGAEFRRFVVSQIRVDAAGVQVQRLGD